MTTTPAGAGKTFLVKFAAGLGVAAATLVFAPAASAEEPGQQCPPPEQQTSDQQQQCEKQQGMPGMPELPDNPQQQKAQEGNRADTNCWVVNGVPRWNAPGTAPAPSGPFDDVQWCPTFYGLQPDFRHGA